MIFIVTFAIVVVVLSGLTIWQDHRAKPPKKLTDAELKAMIDKLIEPQKKKRKRA